MKTLLKQITLATLTSLSAAIAWSTLPAKAVVLTYKLEGDLENGGSFSGKFSYDTDAGEINGFEREPKIGLFGLNDWEVTVISPAAGSITFTEGNQQRASILVSQGTLASVITWQFSDDSCQNNFGSNLFCRLLVNWQYLGSDINVAPSPDDYGNFVDLVFIDPNTVAWSEFGVFDAANGTAPERVSVIDAQKELLRSVPETRGGLVGLGLIAGGLFVSKKKLAS